MDDLPTCISSVLLWIPLFKITATVYIASRLPQHAACFSSGNAEGIFSIPLS